MKNLSTVLMAGLSTMLLSLTCTAQTSETQSGLKVPPSLDQPGRAMEYNDDDTGLMDDDTGLMVEELRYKDRLGKVTIQHGDDGIREYYDLQSNYDEIYQDGELIERGVPRTWRLGGGQ